MKGKEYTVETILLLQNIKIYTNYMNNLPSYMSHSRNINNINNNYKLM